MRKLLYLVKDSEGVRRDTLVPDQSSEAEVTVVLVQDGVMLTHVPVHRVYALSDDAATRHITSSYPVVSYADLLRMMFDADAVIAL